MGIKGKSSQYWRQRNCWPQVGPVNFSATSWQFTILCSRMETNSVFEGMLDMVVVGVLVAVAVVVLVTLAV